MNVWRLSWRVSQHDPRSFWVGWSAFVVFFTLPAAVGWILGRSFDALARAETAEVFRWVSVLAVVEVVRMASIHLAAIQWAKAWVHMETLLRANMLAAQVASGGPDAGSPVASAGEAITHFRDDTEDVANFVDGLVDVSGGLVFSAVAAFVLGATDVTAAVVLLFPLGAVAIGTRALDTRIKAYRSADRAAAAAVTGLVGDVMASATTIKVNAAAPAVVERLRTLVDRRRYTAVRDRVLDDGVQAFSQAAADVGLGLVLLVSAAGLASGSFDVGQLAVFAAYLGWLSFLPRMIGRALARRKQAEVAFDRMRRLVADTDAEHTARPRAVPIRPRDRPQRPTPDRPERVPLERFDVVDLTVTHAGETTPVLADITFSVSRGDVVVVTGPVGSGKTTLLRAVLGLLARAEVDGEVRWNGVTVTDRAAFMVPPNAAYLPQVPHLLSDTVSDNVGLGPIGADELQRAVAMAAFAADLAAMPDGAATLIGPRGLRLSGGQRQRLAAARALVHAPELVVLDDLSSAVDVETEIELWTNLAEVGMTVLAVSHRPVAFDRADQVLRLETGRLVTEAVGR